MAGSAIGSAVAVSTSNVASLSGLPTVDGVSVGAGKRVLLVGQSTASQNGPWIVHTGAWTRPSDFASGTGDGSFLAVEAGTANAGSIWVLVGTSITIDTTAQTWVPLKLPFGESLPPPSGDATGATDLAVLQAVFNLAGPGDTIWIRGLYVINAPLKYPGGISVVGTGRNVVEGSTITAGVCGFQQALGSSANFWQSSTPSGSTAVTTGTTMPTPDISTSSLTVKVTSTANIAVGMAVVNSTYFFAGTIVTSVVDSTHFTIDRLPAANSSTSTVTIGFSYGYALLTPNGYYTNLSSIDAPSEFVNLFFDGQNRTGPAGSGGNTVGHLLILPMGRCRVSNCCFTDSAGCGLIIADSNSNGGAWATGASAEPRITENLFRNCGQLSFLETSSPVAGQQATDGYFTENVIQSPAGGGYPSNYMLASGTSANGSASVTVGSTTAPPVGSRFCGQGIPAGIGGSGGFVGTPVTGSPGSWSVPIVDIAGNPLAADSNAGAGSFAWGFGNGMFPAALLLAGAGWFIMYNDIYDCAGDGLNIQGDTSATIIGNEVDSFGLAGCASATYTGINIARQSTGSSSSMTGSVPVSYIGNDVKLRGTGVSSAPACAIGTTVGTIYVWHGVTVPSTAGMSVATTIAWAGNRSHLSEPAITNAADTQYQQYAWNVLDSSAALNIQMTGGNVEDPAIKTFQVTPGPGTVNIYRPVTTRYLAKSTAYPAVDGDYITVTGTTTISTPMATYAGARFKVVSNDATHTITIAATSGTINGAASITIVNSRYTAKEVVCDGTNWFAT
jgi:hypothetical protein